MLLLQLLQSIELAFRIDEHIECFAINRRQHETNSIPPTDVHGLP